MQDPDGNQGADDNQSVNIEFSELGTPTESPRSGLTIFKPKPPKFGGLKQVSNDTWAAWTGGKPHTDWTGLADPIPSTIDPNQFRVTSISSRAKSKAYRVQGLPKKFSRTGDLQVFQKKVWKHLVEHGLDTITYMTDPTDEKKVVSVVDSHARFDVKEGIKQANDMANTKSIHETWDSYDLDNIRDAKDFLYNSLDDDLEGQLYEVCSETDTFAALWLRLIHIVKSVSIDRFDIATMVVTIFAAKNCMISSTSSSSQSSESHWSVELPVT